MASRRTHAGMMARPSSSSSSSSSSRTSSSSANEYPRLILFHMNGCPHCKAFTHPSRESSDVAWPSKPSLHRASTRNNVFNLVIESVEHSSPSDDALVSAVRDNVVKGYPTVVLVYKHKYLIYEGERSFLHALKWAVSSVPQLAAGASSRR